MPMYFSSLMVLILASSAPPLIPPSKLSECAISLVILFSCISHLMAPPNSASTTSFVACCQSFYQAVITAEPPCVCYLLRDPLILGVPIDCEKLISMFFSCRVNGTSYYIFSKYERSVLVSIIHHMNMNRC